MNLKWWTSGVTSTLLQQSIFAAIYHRLTAHDDLSETRHSPYYGSVAKPAHISRRQTALQVFNRIMTSAYRMADKTLIESQIEEPPNRLSNSSTITKDMKNLEFECETLSNLFLELVASLKTAGNFCAPERYTPEAVVNEHIHQLKKYNETKDLALHLVSMIADQRGITIQEVFDDMKIQHP